MEIEIEDRYEVASVNPAYISLIEHQEEVNPIENKRNGNKWGKIFLGLSVIGMILMATGLPLHAMAIVLEEDAIPFDLGNMEAYGEKIMSIPVNIGNFIAYEIWHWGQWPSVSALEEWLTAALVGVGLSFLVPFVSGMVSFIFAAISAYGLSTSSIIFGIEYFLATVSISINPAILGTVAASIVAS